MLYTGFTKLHIGLAVLVKKISVLINFLLQNTNLVSVHFPKFCWSCLKGLTNLADSVVQEQSYTTDK